MKRDFDYIILGAGPAGVQLGYYLGKQQRDYVILERGHAVGAFFETFPRHRKLISINKRFTGSDDAEFSMRHDWNSLLSDEYAPLMKDYDTEFFPSADSLLRYLRDYVEQHGIQVISDTEIVEVSRPGRRFELIDSAGNTWRANTLVVATGLAREMRPDVPGIELCESYWDMGLDTREYENQRVLVVGKGNSAFETADHLISAASVIHLASPRSITMAWKSHYVGNLRAVNNNILDTYQLKSQNAVLDAELISVRKRDDGRLAVELRYTHADCEIEELVYDRVICCTGFKFDPGIYAQDCTPMLTENMKYPRMSPEFESINIPGLYFAGTITHALDYRKTTSGFIHGFRYNVRALAQILADRQHAEPLHYMSLDADPGCLAETALARVNRSAALWQQPGFFGDCLVCEGDSVRHYQDLPVAYIERYCARSNLEHFVVTLEYGGEIEGDPFCVERIHRLDVERARRSQFLHPIVRHYKDGECVAEHHVIEDLEGVWVEAEHRQPLEAFFAKALALSGMSIDRQGDVCHRAQDMALQAS